MALIRFRDVFIEEVQKSPKTRRTQFAITQSPSARSTPDHQRTPAKHVLGSSMACAQRGVPKNDAPHATRVIDRAVVLMIFYSDLVTLSNQEQTDVLADGRARWCPGLEREAISPSIALAPRTHRRSPHSKSARARLCRNIFSQNVPFNIAHTHTSTRHTCVHT